MLTPTYSLCYVMAFKRTGFVWLVGCLVSLRPRQHLGYISDGSQDWRLTILRAATHETERGNHDFCLSRSHYTDTDPTSRKRLVSVGIELTASSPGVARSTDRATPPQKDRIFTPSACCIGSLSYTSRGFKRPPSHSHITKVRDKPSVLSGHALLLFRENCLERYSKIFKRINISGGVGVGGR